MFGLIRRISHSVIPRPDRPWADDPTSNAPAKRKKRRMSSSELGMDAEDPGSLKKKMRGDSVASDATDTVQEPSSSQTESKAVKEVTEGVKEVELVESDPAESIAPEAVPLPEETSGELDEPASDITPPVEAVADDVFDDNASSLNEEPIEHNVNGVSNGASSETPREALEIPVAHEKLDTATAKTQLKNDSPTETTQVDSRGAE